MADDVENPEVYYFWERQDKTESEVGHTSFLPDGTLAEAVQDAHNELTGANKVTEQDIQEQMNILLGVGQTKH